MRPRTFDDKDLARLFLVALAVVGLASASTGVPPEELAVVPCPFHRITGVPCPGCGMTRSCIALSRGDIGSAWSHHPFAIGLVGLAAAYAFFPRRVRAAWGALPPPLRGLLLATAIALCLALWVSRLPRIAA